MWSFVHLSDLHLGSERDGEWNNRFLCTMMREVMVCLSADLKALKPDFMLITGDVVSVQTREAMLSARTVLDSIGIPYYPMGGNHDFVLPESRTWFLEAFGGILPEPRSYYTFTHKNLRFCAMDPWWRWPDGSLRAEAPRLAIDSMDESLKGLYWALPEEQMLWLEGVLSRNQATPTAIAIHYPAVPTPGRLQKPDFHDGGMLENGPELMGMLAKYRQVRAVFAGHTHANFIERDGLVTHVTTGGLPEFPVEYRVVEVYEDRMEVKTCGLSDPSFAQRSLIPGHGYTSGAPADRATVIPLR
jgi:3',5'-cyclic AMP phosphodiesterase CpdA